MNWYQFSGHSQQRTNNKFDLVTGTVIADSRWEAEGKALELVRLHYPNNMFHMVSVALLASQTIGNYQITVKVEETK